MQSNEGQSGGDESIIEAAIREAAKKRGQSVDETVRDALNDTKRLRQSGVEHAGLIADEAAQQIKDASKKIKKRRK